MIKDDTDSSYFLTAQWVFFNFYQMLFKTKYVHLKLQNLGIIESA